MKAAVERPRGAWPDSNARRAFGKSGRARRGRELVSALAAEPHLKENRGLGRNPVNPLADQR